MGRVVLIIGGTGVFGQRLVRHLARIQGVTLFVSSRSVAKAEALIKTVNSPAATLNAVGLDCRVNLAARLEEIGPSVVVDCSGPFQGAGYDTAQAVVRSGAHFVDLADARDYLAGFAPALDDLARQHGVTALSGASSTPALSTCVATELTAGWQRVDTIDICITPGGKSEVGRSVIEAILSYAGREIPVWSGGKLSKAIGWRGAQTIDIPGLGCRRVATVETYDAEYLGPSLQVQSRVAFSAGLESRVEQWGIEALAWLRHRGVLGGLNWLIPPLLQARRITRIPTSDVGGMMIEISGVDETGTTSQAQWILIARNDHGPFVPVMAAAAAVNKLLRGMPDTGARFAHHAMTLAEICKEMADYLITVRRGRRSDLCCSLS